VPGTPLAVPDGQEVPTMVYFVLAALVAGISVVHVKKRRTRKATEAH
jgi:hypothetical protein